MDFDGSTCQGKREEIQKTKIKEKYKQEDKRRLNSNGTRTEKRKEDKNDHHGVRVCDCGLKGSGDSAGDGEDGNHVVTTET